MEQAGRGRKGGRRSSKRRAAGDSRAIIDNQQVEQEVNNSLGPAFFPSPSPYSEAERGEREKRKMEGVRRKKGERKTEYI